MKKPDSRGIQRPTKDDDKLRPRHQVFQQVWDTKPYRLPALGSAAAEAFFADIHPRLKGSPVGDLPKQLDLSLFDGMPEQFPFPIYGPAADAFMERYVDRYR